MSVVMIIIDMLLDNKKIKQTQVSQKGKEMKFSMFNVSFFSVGLLQHHFRLRRGEILHSLSSR